MTNEQEKQIMDEIIQIINSEQVNMINIKNNPIEVQKEEDKKEL